MSRFTRLVGAPMVVVFLTSCSEPRNERLLTSRTTSPPQRTVDLIDDQPHLPDKFSIRVGGLAVLATSFNALVEQWERFHMDGDLPDTNMHEGAVLMVGFGESGTCPLRYEGILIKGPEIRVKDKPREKIENTKGPLVYACTKDFRFRTLVFALPEDRVPEGEITVRVPHHGTFPLERH